MRMTHPRCQPNLGFNVRIKAVNAGDRSLREHVTADCRQHVRAFERTADGALVEIERVESEYIVMHDSVVPWRTRTIVAEVITGHILVRSKPAGVIVDALARTARPFGPLLAARRDTIGELTSLDRSRICRQ